MVNQLALLLTLRSLYSRILMTVVATSSTKAEYVAAASCCAQVLWIQNHMLDYGEKYYGLCFSWFWTNNVAELNANNWNDVLEQVKRREKQDKTVMSMTYNEIRPIFEKHYNSIKAFLGKREEEVTVQEEISKRKGENLEQDTAKKYRIDEEAEELKTHLQIVANDDDDVYAEATPLASKMILLVERKYPLTHFTLEQMLNNVRLKVKEESEMSLELLRLVRRQLNEGYVPE
nr:putative ribonuclease H-like domain-containing protein [Tanacetum cinerariifolium]